MVQTAASQTRPYATKARRKMDETMVPALLRHVGGHVRCTQPTLGKLAHGLLHWAGGLKILGVENICWLNEFLGEMGIVVRGE